MRPSERLAANLVTATFMLSVGLSLPPIMGAAALTSGWRVILFHVLIVTVLSNLGKPFPAFCYRKEASPRERLALAVAMFPRGEVGAGILVIALSYGIGGLMLTVAMFSLALNLLCTGLFIVVVKKLIGTPSEPAGAGRG